MYQSTFLQVFKCIGYLFLVTYFLLFIYSIIRKNSLNNGKIIAASQFIYPVISIYLIFSIIRALDSLTALSFSIASDINPFYNSGYENYEQESFYIFISIIAPIIFIFSAFIWNYSKAFFTISEIDEGSFMTKPLNGFKKKTYAILEFVLRSIIIILFISLESYLLQTLSINHINLPSESGFEFLNLTSINFYHSLAITGTVSSLLYTLLIVWFLLNIKGIGKRHRYLNAIFYFAGFINSLLVVGLGFYPNIYLTINKYIFYLLVPLGIISTSFIAYLIIVNIKNTFLVYYKDFKTNNTNTKGELKIIQTQK